MKRQFIAAVLGLGMTLSPLGAQAQTLVGRQDNGNMQQILGALALLGVAGIAYDKYRDREDEKDEKKASSDDRHDRADDRHRHHGSDHDKKRGKGHYKDRGRGHDARALPGACMFSPDRRANQARGYGPVFSRSCLARAGHEVSRLPRACERRVMSRGSWTAAYDARCLGAQGWRVAQHRY